MDPAPLGLVTATASTLEPVAIRAYDGIYEALGVGREEFTAWQSRYGYDSLGVGERGEIFIPAYPTFSKVAWMFVDPVDLSASETLALIGECERAMANARDPAAHKELEAIHRLASEAIAQSATLRFGHP